MIELSPEFRGLATKIYTFSFLCLAVKLLKISSISQAGIEIEIENSSLVAGAFAVVAFLLTISAVFKLFGDHVRTRVSDEVHADEIGTLSPSDLRPEPGRRLTYTEANFGWIKFASVSSFIIEALVPLCAGTLIAWYASHDMVEFLKEITR
tara:strand:+ start:699 stop:1151 length:453 start_codon:yes stop_codon:yes gene_type:complete